MFSFLNCVYFCICVCMLAHIHTTCLPYSQKLEKHISIPTRATGRCQLPHVGPENQTHVLCKNGKSSELLRHLSDTTLRSKNHFNVQKKIDKRGF